MKKITLLVGVLLIGITFAKAEGTELTNLALNKTATASSIYRADFEASKAFDGVATKASRWSAANHTDSNPTSENSWLQVDLGEALEFNTIVITEFGNKIANYRIETTDTPEDELSWTVLVADMEQAFEGLVNKESEWPAITFITAKKRYVRLWINRSYDKLKAVLDEPTICEMGVYNDLNATVGLKDFTENVLSLNIQGDILQIQTVQTVVSVKIVDMSGQTILDQPFSATVPIAGLSAGIYLVQIKTTDGATVTRKIVKK